MGIALHRIALIRKELNLSIFTGGMRFSVRQRILTPALFTKVKQVIFRNNRYCTMADPRDSVRKRCLKNCYQRDLGMPITRIDSITTKTRFIER
jgi:hypothetical protein